MFRTAELGRKVAKADFHETVPALRAELLEVQQQLRSRRFPVIIVFGGVDGAGKSETVDLLNEWMDPRWLETRAYGQPSDEMMERPEYWRFWRDLPPKGRIGIFLSCWYSRPILDRVHGRSSDAEFDEELDRVVAFERQLADDGALILKFWMHLGKEAQKERFKALEKNPLTRWRVTETDWNNWRMYEQFIAAAERTIMRTSIGQASWQIVEGWDHRYRSLTVGGTILKAIQKRIEADKVHQKISEEIKSRSNDYTVSDAPVLNKSADGGALVIPLPRVTVLSQLDMSQHLAKSDYKKKLQRLEGNLNQSFRRAKALGVSTVLVFEGWDAAGKGGAIRRITAPADPRDFQVIPIAAPTDEERQHHYMWRFWRHLSRAGRLTIFDRSWYGRVLVERVEGFAREDEWRRAYGEIIDFEEQLVAHGIVLCKFWIHITKEEQLNRFKAREGVVYKKWKLTEEDWRNRERWDDYEIAVNEMVEHTSTTLAPWTLIEGNDKRFARIKVLRTVNDAIASAIAGREADEKRKQAPKQAKVKHSA